MVKKNRIVTIKNKNKVYTLHWQPKRLNSTIRTLRILWLVTNSLMYISKTIYEGITINNYMKLLLIRMSSKIKTIKMSDSKTVNAL